MKISLSCHTLSPNLLKWPNYIDQCKVVAGFSDHEAVNFSLNTKPKISKKVRRKVYLFGKADMCALKAELMDFQSEFLENHPASQSVEESWNLFKNKTNELMDKHIPSKMTSTKHSNPWITQEVRRMSKKKQRLYNKAKVTNKPDDWKHFKEYQKATQKQIRQNYWSFQSNMFDENDKSNKAFWKFIKAKKLDSTNASSLKDGTKVVFSSKGKAACFNEQFRSVFTCEDATTIPDMGTSAYPVADHINISCDGVLKLLMDLKTNKATGPDAISARFLIKGQCWGDSSHLDQYLSTILGHW